MVSHLDLQRRLRRLLGQRLVVDDEINVAELLKMALRYEGWEVQSVLARGWHP
jgi:hypothetical protein|nr:hypothetical protein [Aeromicrobium sp.]